MNGNLFEALIGAVVLVVAGVFLVFAFTTADIGSVQGYQVVARFDRVDGLNIGSDVRLSGIKVGTVTSMELDHETFLAVVLGTPSGVCAPAFSRRAWRSAAAHPTGAKRRPIQPPGPPRIFHTGARHTCG